MSFAGVREVSEVEPKSSVGDDSAESEHSPHHFVSGMTLRRHNELCEFSWRRHSWVNLTMVLVKVNHVEHDLACFLLVGSLRQQGDFIWSHALHKVLRRSIQTRVLALSVTTIKNAHNCAQTV